MRVIASTHKCIASGTCVMTCAEVFGQREEDGIVQVLNEHPGLDLLKRVQQAVDLCPSLALSLEDEQDVDQLTVVEDRSGE